jgi:hypothetical protein
VAGHTSSGLLASGVARHLLSGWTVGRTGAMRTTWNDDVHLVLQNLAAVQLLAWCRACIAAA